MEYYAEKKLKSVFLLFGLPLLFISVYLLCNRRFYFFDDEFFTLSICNEKWPNFLAALKASDVHPPLSYLLFKIWFIIFGQNIYASQALSLIFMAIGLSVYLTIFTKLFPKINWLFSLVAIHPLLILWSGSARYYPLLFLLFNLGILIFIKIFNKDYSIKTIALYISVSLLGLYTEFMYCLGLIPQCFLILLSIFAESDKTKRLSYLTRFSLVILIIMALYLPWLPEIALRIVQNLQRFARPSPILNFAYIIYGGFIGQSIMPYDFIVVIPAVIVFSFLFIGGIIKMFRAQRNYFFIWFGLCIGAVVLAIPIRLLTVRHFLFFPGLLLIPVLYFIASFPKKWLRYTFFVIVLSIYIYGDLNIALKRDIHKGGMSDPISKIIRVIVKKATADKGLKVILYSHVLNYPLQAEKEISNQIIYLSASDLEVYSKLSFLFHKIKPRRILYVWNYYGAQPDFANLDNSIQRLLDESYIKVSEVKFGKDERINKISRLINKAYLNPTGCRFLIQEYQLKGFANGAQQ